MLKRLLPALLAGLLLTGCAQTLPQEPTAFQETVQTTEAPKAVTFTDDLDRTVTVENPRRVATLLASFTDVWYLAGGEVVAAPDDAWEDLTLPMAEDAHNLGNTKDLSLETLFAADPDFIIASSKTRVDLDWLETLETSGIPVAYFSVSGFDDYLRMLKICTDITGRSDLYEKNGVAVQAQIDKAVETGKERVEAHGAPNVLSLRASAASVRAKGTRGNVLGEMLKALGCVNIADSDNTLLENLSMEHIIAQDPEYIFIVQSGDDDQGMKAKVDQYIAENPAWNQLTAVKEGKVFYLEKQLYNMKPYARWGESYEKLEKLFQEHEK